MIRVVGSINLDLIASVDRLPAPGETVPGSTFSMLPGGKGANQALAARRAGTEVAMSGAVGDDSFAEPALALLGEANIDLSGVRKTDNPTGIALILVEPGGENQIAVVPGSNGAVGADAVSQLARNDIILLQLEIPIPTVRAAIETARSVGAVSVLNAAPALPAATELLAEVDHLIVNETEFDFFANRLGLDGNSRRARMRRWHQKTGRTIVVTLGPAGVVAVSRQGMIEEPAVSIDPVDTVGAGDTFCGYYAAALAEGKEIAEALRLANRAAALACLKPGAQPAIPTREDVSEFRP